jgi:16S rRNA (guanine966-N2)-methyltransferase
VNTKKNVQQLRIIAGKWRGRKITFANNPAIRPTGDRIRETLFNWLMPYIQGANCLDVFAGSGILGFEALSRGARQVSFIDKDAATLQQIRQIANQFACNTQIDLLNFALPAGKLTQTYEIIFLDPPFAKQMIPMACAWLTQQQCLADNALIYIEAEKTTLTLPANLQTVRQASAGKVQYGLYTHNA